VLATAALLAGACCGARDARAAEGFPRWQDFADVDVIEVVTTDPDGDLRETPVWFVLIDGDAWLRTNDSRWLANIERDPAFRVRVEGLEFEVGGQVVHDAAMIERIDAASLKKYGWQERLIHVFRMSPPDILRIVPRKAVAQPGAHTD